MGCNEVFYWHGPESFICFLLFCAFPIASLVVMSLQIVVLLSLLCTMVFLNQISALVTRNLRVSRVSQLSKQLAMSRLYMSSDSGHNYGPGSSLSPDLEKVLTKLKNHQETVPRLSFAEEVRTLIESSLK